ncbi:hypothetical protein [Shinella sp.]|uniref:hypothetical protein n=1 Tax=Shinella sp. TaxID=1870904 RepID=UPI003F6F3FDB
MPKLSQLQYISSRQDGSIAVAEEALTALVHALGPDAGEKLDDIERRLIHRFKTSEPPAEYEMQHAELITPTLDEITRLIGNARRKI